MSRITCEDFGVLQDGRAVQLYKLRNTKGTAVRICTFGARVQSLCIMDRQGEFRDVVLGYDHIAGYEADDACLGAIIGRCAGRIERGQVRIQEKSYQLDCNEGENHLHGGAAGLHNKLWQADITPQGLRLQCLSPAGESGYPGNLRVTVTYALSNDNELSILYEAVSDEDTICNLTNHMYFNLGGSSEASSVLDEEIQIFADSYMAADAALLADGRILSVEDTPLDLRQSQRIGEHIDDDFGELRQAGGYDHTFLVRDAACEVEVSPGDFGYDPSCPIDYLASGLKNMAFARNPRSGLTLRAYTNCPCVQFYTGNHLGQQPLGKGGKAIGHRSGFCLEAQGYPNAFAHPKFVPPVLKKGEIWRAQSVYVFGVGD